MSYQPWQRLFGKTIHLHTFDHNFGIVIPCPTGFEWGQQTKGVMCSYVTVEGIYIPLEEPLKILGKIQDANYNSKPKLLSKHWKELRKWLKDFQDFEYREVKAPNGMPENQEGLQWIKITRWEDSSDTRKELVGKIVAFYYPNCD